ncbi:MAG: autoinducer-2 kinase, partial [Campylobacterales bacterium]|nr:autoinducer-2 kinase [Campylobacterales bacterium]
YDKMYKMNMLSDWIIFKLSGELVSEPSNAGTSGIFNLSSRTWQSDMMTKVNLKDDIFPNIYESGEIVGSVSKECAKLTGLSESCVVVTGGGDVQLGSLGLGVVKSGDSAILGGTFWQQIVNLDKVCVDSDMKLRINPHVQRGLIQAEGITFFVGLVTRWFRDVFCETEKMEAIKRGIDTYEILEELASGANVGSNGVMPIFSDVMNYGKWYHASPSFLNLNINPKICSKKEMFRSILENACIVSSINLDNIINFSNVKIDSLTFAGGASKGKLWGQILADVTNKSIKVPAVKEATSLGGAMLGAIAVGHFKDSSEACLDWVKVEKSFEPNQKNNKIYSEIKEKWQIAYKKQLELVDMSITESMWKAPGV